MKASLLWDLLSPVLLIAIIAPHSEALSPLETCQLVENTTFIGDPDDCQGWYYCLNGAPIGGKCKTGLLYNSYTQSCDYASNVVCAGSTSTMCKGLNAVYKRDPSNCAGYCYCSNGETACTTCPTNQVFDLASTSCVYPSSDVLCESESPCLLAPNVFIKNPNSCAGWFRCYNGEIAAEGSCTPGLFYDALAGKCNYESAVECNTVTSAPVVDAPAYTGTDCAGAVNDFVADPKTCNGYYYCKMSGTDPITHWATCPKGSQYSAGKCINSYNVNPPCSENRCAGMSYNYVAVPETECRSYVLCTKELSSTEKYNCENILYPYFNEKLQGCQAAPITDQPICTEPLAA